jgi:hypothetical protein
VITGERYVVLGLGAARSGWFSDLARLATAGGIPIEFVKSVSAEETRVRLSSGRAFSALLVDGGLPAVDRDLLHDARRSGVEVFVVADPRITRDWQTLGATTVLAREFSLDDLLTALDGMTKAIPRGVADGEPVEPPVRAWAGELIAVTGARGSGASTIAAGLAQGFAARFAARHRPGAVLLADLALDADQGVLHHAPDIVPGLPELVEAHRGATLTPSAVHSMVFDVEERGYHLLLGMRRRRAWSSIRPRALDAALESLLATYPVVIGDVDPDVDGHHECGSFEVEDRNATTRVALALASVTVVVGTATTGGLHSLGLVLRDLIEHGVDPLRLVSVVNHAPRSPRERAAIARALPLLSGTATSASRLGAPLFVVTRRSIEDATRGGRPFPAPLVAPITRAVGAALETRELTFDDVYDERPERVAPGTLGRWSEPEADAV